MRHDTSGPIGSAVDRVLRLVADGRLSADEAGPILDALDAARTAESRADDIRTAGLAGMAAMAGPRQRQEGGPARFARLEVTQRGRKVVDLRIPASLGRLALDRIPGLSGDQVDQVSDAIAGGSRGPILDVVDDDGDGVRIVIE